MGRWKIDCQRPRVRLQGQSFSVNITTALRAAIMTGAEIDVVIHAIDLNIDRVTYHAMSAAEFIAGLVRPSSG